MPIIPIRQIGSFGVLPDMNAFDTPMFCPSFARNIRFFQNNVHSSPTFKELASPLRFDERPLSVFSYSDIDGNLVPQVLLDDGKLYDLNSANLIGVGPETALSTVGTVTTTRLAQVTYVNVSSSVPVQRGPNSPEYSPLPEWDVEDKARAIRSYKDFLIALNVTKGSEKYPTMVKWSDAAQAGAPPPNWSVTDESSLSGENVLADAQGVILDGMKLGSTFLIYTTDEVYRMDYVGEPFIFSFESLTDGGGLIESNCVVEAAGSHFYMTKNDIRQSDGINSRSIAAGRVQEYIFSRLADDRISDCFTFHDSSRKEVYFCYAARSDVARFSDLDYQGCNEAAVYNYLNDTWTFVDLPGVTSATGATLASLETWDTAPDWDQLESTWLALKGETQAVPLFSVVGENGKQSSLLFYDDFGSGSISNPVRKDYDCDGVLEIGLKEFDDLGIPIIAWKAARTVYPQCLVKGEDEGLGIRVGGSRGPQSDVAFDDETYFRPHIDSKRDSRVNARYLMFRFRFPARQETQLSGFDLDLTVLTRR